MRFGSLCRGAAASPAAVALAAGLGTALLVAGCGNTTTGSPEAGVVVETVTSTAAESPSTSAPPTTETETVETTLATATPPRTRRPQPKPQSPPAPKCTVDQFDAQGLRFDKIRADVANATIHARLTMVNDFGPACTVDGFGGFAMEELDGTSIPVTLARVDTGRRAKFTVRQHDRIAKDMAFRYRPDEGDQNATCYIANIGLVTLPGDTHSIHVFMSDSDGFPGGICWGRTVSGGPFYPL